MTHYLVDKSKWYKLSFFEQMGNIGSEVGRSLGAKESKDNQAAEAALKRALDLFESSVASTKHYPRLKELMRAKEEYLRAYVEGADREGIENYFMQFAIAARLHR